MDYQDDDLWTPLHFAAAHGHKTIVQLLFKVRQHFVMTLHNICI